MVAQAWTDTVEVERRSSRRIATSKPSYAQAVGSPYAQPARSRYLEDVRESRVKTPENQMRPISQIHLQQTPQHVAAREEKAEIVKNTMAILFLQAILESSRTSISSSEGSYMEWHFIPTKLHVATSKAACACINDGSLFRKQYQKRSDDKEWVNADDLLYTSIEVRGSFLPHQNHKNPLQSLIASRQRPNTAFG
jgi:hypothetical protein